jgi:hypothetical protein
MRNDPSSCASVTRSLVRIIPDFVQFSAVLSHQRQFDVDQQMADMLVTHLHSPQVDIDKLHANFFALISSDLALERRPDSTTAHEAFCPRPSGIDMNEDGFCLE